MSGVRSPRGTLDKPSCKDSGCDRVNGTKPAKALNLGKKPLLRCPGFGRFGAFFELEPRPHSHTPRRRPRGHGHIPCN